MFIIKSRSASPSINKMTIAQAHQPHNPFSALSFFTSTKTTIHAKITTPKAATTQTTTFSSPDEASASGKSGTTTTNDNSLVTLATSWSPRGLRLRTLDGELSHLEGRQSSASKQAMSPTLNLITSPLVMPSKRAALDFLFIKKICIISMYLHVLNVIL